MRKRGKLLSLMLIGLLAVGSTIGLVACSGTDDYSVAVFLYKSDDSYITTVKTALETELSAIENVEYKFFNGEGSQATQTGQVDAAITVGYDLMVFNVVDNQTDAGTDLAQKATDAGIKSIFFNREVTDEAINVSNDISYVGTDPNKPGYMIGEMIDDMIPNQEAFDKYDRNGDGKLNYVMLRAEPGNAEADGRTKYSISEANRHLKENLGVTTDLLENIGADINAEWDTTKAQAAMTTFLTSDAENIDLVIANNDSMAIGALAALEVSGFNKKDSKTENPDMFIPLFGVDALDDAVQAINDGKMSGTVKQDGVAMAKAIASIISNHMNGEELLEGSDYAFDEGSRKLRIAYSKVV